jgi:hypothetical protein
MTPVKSIVRTEIVAFRVTPEEHEFYKRSVKINANLLRLLLRVVKNSDTVTIDATYSDRIKISYNGSALIETDLKELNNG